MSTPVCECSHSLFYHALYAPLPCNVDHCPCSGFVEQWKRWSDTYTPPAERTPR